MTISLPLLKPKPSTQSLKLIKVEVPKPGARFKVVESFIRIYSTHARLQGHLLLPSTLSTSTLLACSIPTCPFLLTLSPSQSIKPGLIGTYEVEGGDKFRLEHNHEPKYFESSVEEESEMRAEGLGVGKGEEGMMERFWFGERLREFDERFEEKALRVVKDLGFSETTESDILADPVVFKEAISEAQGLNIVIKLEILTVINLICKNASLGGKEKKLLGDKEKKKVWDERFENWLEETLK